MKQAAGTGVFWQFGEGSAGVACAMARGSQGVLGPQYPAAFQS